MPDTPSYSLSNLGRVTDPTEPWTPLLWNAASHEGTWVEGQGCQGRRKGADAIATRTTFAPMTVSISSGGQVRRWPPW